MRAYILVTGIVFALLVIAHIARAVAEGIQVVRDPFFTLSTLVAASLCIWAWSLYRR